VYTCACTVVGRYFVQERVKENIYSVKMKIFLMLHILFLTKWKITCSL